MFKGGGYGDGGCRKKRVHEQSFIPLEVALALTASAFTASVFASLLGRRWLHGIAVIVVDQGSMLERVLEHCKREES